MSSPKFLDKLNRVAPASAVAVLLICAFASAQPKAAAGACSRPLWETEVAALESALKPYVETLRRPVALYHWAWRGPVSRPIPGIEVSESQSIRRMGFDEAIDLRDANGGYSGPAALRPMALGPHGEKSDIVGDYFRALSSQFASIGADGRQWNTGTGFYVATDPVSSLSFAGDPGVLIELSVPARTRFLDARGSDVRPTLAFPTHLKHRLSARMRACLKEQAVDLVGDVHEFIDPASASSGSLRALLYVPSIRAALVEALRRLRVDAIAVSWLPEAFLACRVLEEPPSRAVRKGMGSALVFIDPELLQRGGNVRAFVSELEVDAAPEKRNEYKRILRHLRAFSIEAYPAMEGLRSPIIHGLEQFANRWEAVLGRPSGDHDPSPFFGCLRSRSAFAEANPVAFRRRPQPKR